MLWTLGCTEEKEVIVVDEIRTQDGTWLDCEDITAFFSQASDGDDCDFGYTCGMGGFCTMQGATCVDGKLAVSELEVVDCNPKLSEPPAPEPRPDISWSECDAALEGGQTGEPCSADTGSWACGRPAQEACCQDIAFCETLYTQPGALVIAKACASQCQVHPVDATRATVSDCPEAQAARPNDPCIGEFSCVAYDFGLESRWCDAGALRVLGAQNFLPAVVMELGTL